MVDHRPEAGLETLRLLVGVLVSGSSQGLARLLAAIQEPSQSTVELHVAVIDNCPCPDTRSVTEQFCREFEKDVLYIQEPEPGIPFARNTCVRAALDQDVDALIFIDDDEWPADGWLDALLHTWQSMQADIVLGPAKAILPINAPAWARQSGVFDKDRRLADGAPIRTAYSYNTLVGRYALETLGPTFDPTFRYTGASDHHYFKQAAAAGLRSVWSPDAVVYEEVKPDRLRLSWVFKRGYRIGAGVTRSTRLRVSRVRTVARIAVLTAVNLGYVVWYVLLTLRYRASWVQGIRRLGIAVGLIGGTIHSYEEYCRVE